MLLPLWLNLEGASPPVIPPVVAPPEVTGGGWASYFAAEQAALQARSRRRKAREDEEAAERELQDARDREIAAFLHAQELLDAERDERARLMALAARYAVAEDVPERVRRAALAAQAKATQAAIDALGREIERAREDEDIAALLILLNQ